MILFTGSACSQGMPGLGSAWLGGAWSGGVCSGAAWSGGSAPRGCLVETPLGGYYCAQFASYWNAFLFFVSNVLIIFVCFKIYFLIDHHYKI